MEIEAAYSRLQRDDPAGWNEYLTELADWAATGGEADAGASDEWPELNL